ncbi:MAG: hypothetical protein QW629_00870 [Candidatus Bathyarchaeia archaeon]
MAEYWAGLAIWKLRIKRKLEKKGALSKEAAKKPEELDISIDTLEKLRKSGIVKRTEDGRYYLHTCKNDQVKTT